MPEHGLSTETFQPFARSELEKSLTERFQHQVNQFPNRLAIGHSTGDLTYDELNRKANVVARKVLERVLPGTRPVALLFHSDTDMIVALLGVLKAGHFSVPLDPSHPAGRNAMIVQEVQPDLLLTNHQGAEHSEALALHVTNILNIEEIPNGTNETNLDGPNLPRSLAFVLFTSGTTGAPKGVVITHQLLMHLVMYHTNTRQICSDDRFSSLTRCHHIGGIADVFRALLNGAGLFPYDLRIQTVGELIEWLIDRHITILHCVPTIFRMLMDQLPSGELLPSLRLIHLGGEPVTKRDVELYQERFSGHCLLVNNFGSSETGPLGQYFVTKNTKLSHTIVPIHLKVEDKEIFLVNRTPLPDGQGEVGEIAVRSQYLSPGYWEKSDNDPVERFVDKRNRFRTFLTGDLGQMGPDGLILYKGRKDHQVNLRGFRVDLIEVEARIRNITDCKDVAVVAGVSVEEEVQLVAYLVSKQDIEPEVTVLRKRLSDILPGYMIPEEFYFLDQFPRTATGKVDRQALSVEYQDRKNPPIECVAPQNELEEGLVQLWKDLLNVPSLGTRNKFIDLGGNSLIATRLSNRIEGWLGIRLTIGDILAHPTIEELSQYILDREPSSPIVDD